MINEKIEELFESNRHLFEGKPVAFDGLVNEQEFLNSKIKTVFLLKEVNYPDMQEDWTNFLASLDNMASKDSEKLYKTWPNVCLWTEVLNNADCTYRDCLNENQSFNEKKLKSNLRKIGIVNLKKTGGAGGSNWKDILQATDKGKDFIVAELGIINPNLVICGGTFYNAKLLFDISDEQVKMLPAGAHYFITGNTLYLEFIHPMWYSVNRNILFAYAKTVFNDLRPILDQIIQL